MFADDVVWRVIVVPIEASRPQASGSYSKQAPLQSAERKKSLAARLRSSFLCSMKVEVESGALTAPSGQSRMDP